MRTFGQLTPTSVDQARMLRIGQSHPLPYGRTGYRSPLIYNRGVGEAPEGQPGSRTWERANLWKTGLFVGGLFVVIVAGAWLFLGAPQPYYTGRRSRVSTPPAGR